MATPQLDNTDFYLFRSYESGRSNFVTMIANVLPFQDPFGGPNFYMLDSNATYAINIDNAGTGRPGITFEFKFQNTRKDLALTVGGASVAIPLINAGPVGAAGNPADIDNLNVQETFTLRVVRNGTAQSVTNTQTGEATFKKPVDYIGTKSLPEYTAYANSHIYTVTIPGCTGTGRVFVGQRKDPFFIAVGKIFDLVNLTQPVGEAVSNTRNDALADKNVTSMIVEVPIDCVKGTDPVIGGFATVTQGPLNNGATVGQVSRIGMPLVNEVVIGLKDKDRFNSSLPVNDAQFLTYVTNPTLPALLETLFASAGVKAPTRFPRDDLVATFLTGLPGINKPATVTPGDELRLNTSTPVTAFATQNRLGVLGNDMAGFPNGRRPNDDVVDIELRVAMGKLISLGLFGTPAQAPSGALEFTDNVAVPEVPTTAAFPYLAVPISGSSPRP